MDAIDLADLDNTSTIDLDPSVWSANLMALRGQQPELAQQLERTALPAHWRPVAGLDGFPTYRLEPNGAPPQWLAGTAAPRTRAGALLRYEQLSGKNPALATIAAGAELRLLLDKLAPQQAVFVFEQETTQLAAVLRIVNFAAEITSGRCIFVPAGSERVFLDQLLERYPGLLPPATIVALPPVSEESLEQLRFICEAVAGQVSDARNRHLQAVVTSPRSAIHDPQSLRLAVLALGPDRRGHRLAAELAGAADELGWTTCCCAARDPRNVHALPHCERLAGLAAELAICIEHPPGVLPLRAGKTVCQWHLSAKDVPESLPNDDTVHLAATPRVAQALRGASVREARLAEFHWASPQSPTPDSESEISDLKSEIAMRNPQSVVIIGDLPDASAPACRIEQPTHKRLWDQLHKTAAKVWETIEITRPATLLRNAERTSGVELGERSLRERLCRIIEYVLIPTVVLERISQVLRQESYEVITIGTGWHRCASESLRPLADDLDDLPAHAAKTAPSAAIFAGSLDPLSPGLFHAAALGWPLLIHSPGRVSLAPQLGGILHPRQHYEAFADAKELRAVLSTLRADPEPFARRAARTRAYLRQDHSYGRRLITLAQELGLECSEMAT